MPFLWTKCCFFCAELWSGTVSKMVFGKKKGITSYLLNKYFTCIFAGTHVTKGHTILHMAVLAFALFIIVSVLCFYCLTTKDLTNKKLFRPHEMHSVFCCRIKEDILKIVHLMKMDYIKLVANNKLKEKNEKLLRVKKGRPSHVGFYTYWFTNVRNRSSLCGDMLGNLSYVCRIPLCFHHDNKDSSVLIPALLFFFVVDRYKMTRQNFLRTVLLTVKTYDGVSGQWLECTTKDSKAEQFTRTILE